VDRVLIAMSGPEMMVGGWRLTNEAKRPRLHRGDERSRDSEMLRENGRQCRRGPT
jgi:hypothetical protein